MHVLEPQSLEDLTPRMSKIEKVRSKDATLNMIRHTAEVPLALRTLQSMQYKACLNCPQPNGPSWTASLQFIITDRHITKACLEL